MKVPKVITSWKNSRRQTVSNVKNVKRREREINKTQAKYFSTRAHKENMNLKIKKMRKEITATKGCF